jgi:ribosome-binding factor A
MATRRQERVSERIHHEISDLLQNEIRDPRLAYVTVTDVEISPDLQLATVFVSALGDDEVRAGALTALERASGYIRRGLAQRLRMRVAPAVRFVLDESWERGARLDALLDSLHGSPSGDGQSPAEGDDDQDAA